MPPAALAVYVFAALAELVEGPVTLTDSPPGPGPPPEPIAMFVFEESLELLHDFVVAMKLLVESVTRTATTRVPFVAYVHEVVCWPATNWEEPPSTV